MAYSPNSTDFNPHTQPLTLYYPDGTYIRFPVSDITVANREAVLWTLMYAIQIGASAVFLIILGLLTGPEKRRTPIFICNVLALIFVIARASTSIEYYLGGFYDAYSFLAYDYADLNPSSRYVSIASSVCALVLRVLIQLSLILQLRVVFVSDPKWRVVLTIFTSIVALVATGLYFKVLVENSKSTMEPIVGIYSGDWTYPAAKAALAVSILIFSTIFVLKLAHGIKRREALGLKKFGPLQIVFIVGCQTMTVPALFTIVDAIVTIEGLAYFTPFMVALLLPLSSMWASSHIEAQTPMNASGIRRFRPKPGSSDDSERGFASANPRVAKKPEASEVVSKTCSLSRIESNSSTECEKWRTSGISDPN